MPGLGLWPLTLRKGVQGQNSSHCPRRSLALTLKTTGLGLDTLALVMMHAVECVFGFFVQYIIWNIETMFVWAFLSFIKVWMRLGWFLMRYIKLSYFRYFTYFVFLAFALASKATCLLGFGLENADLEPVPGLCVSVHCAFRPCVVGCRLSCGSHRTCFCLRWRVEAYVWGLSSTSPSLHATISARFFFSCILPTS